MKKTFYFLLISALLILLIPSINLSQQEQAEEPEKKENTLIPIPLTYESMLGIQNEPPFATIQAPPISPSWQSRHSSKYRGMVAGDFDNDGYDEVAFDFGAQGIWVYDPNASTKWNQIRTDDPVWMIAVGIGSPADDELIVESSANWLDWWNYNGYPGTWTAMTSSDPMWAYDAGDVGDGDTGHEVVVFFDCCGIYVADYTGSGTFGGFDMYKIRNTTTSYPGIPAAFAAADSELVHDFDSAGVEFWNYSAGFPSTNWTQISTNNVQDDNVAVNGSGSDDQYYGDFGPSLGTFRYTYGTPGTWARINWAYPCEVYPVAYDTANALYEIIYEFCGTWTGLWGYNPTGDSWTRLSWNNPHFILGADVATSANGGNNGDEAIGDFGSIGMWINYSFGTSWTRINWGDPQGMIQANLDSDPEKELVIDFGSGGVWTWDQATDTWTRISWNNPETNSPEPGSPGSGSDK